MALRVGVSYGRVGFRVQVRVGYGLAFGLGLGNEVRVRVRLPSSLVMNVY